MIEKTELEARVRQLEADVKGLIVQGMARDLAFSILIKLVPNLRDRYMKLALEDILPTIKRGVGGTEAEQAFIKAVERQIKLVNGNSQDLSEVMRREFSIVQGGRGENVDPT